MKQGAGRRITGACKARVKIGNRLLLVCTVFFLSAPATSRATSWASSDIAPPSTTSFAYRVSHPVTPLPDSVIEKIADAENTADAAFEEDLTKDAEAGTPRVLSRPELCSTLASVAEANGLPVPFFANLIWHESSFNTITISRAGAQGIAQFMPRTAAMYDLINPFEPIHAINVSAKFLRELQGQFGNLGLAAAGYNAGPRRVADWIAGRGALPAETRRYVLRITGRPAEYWLQGKAHTGPEALLMPAKAPCIEVAVEVEAQVQRVRVARLVTQLADAAARTRQMAAGERKPAETDVKIAKADPRSAKAKARLAKAEAKAARDAKKQAKAVEVGAARKPVKAESKSEPKTADKDKAKTATKLAAKVESGNDGRSEPKNKGKTEPAPKIEAKSDAKPEAKIDAKPDAKPDTKPAAKSETGPNAAGAAADTPKDGTKSETEPEAKEDAKETAEEAPPPRRVRRARVAEFDRHTGQTY